MCSLPKNGSRYPSRMQNALSGECVYRTTLKTVLAPVDLKSAHAFRMSSVVLSGLTGIRRAKESYEGFSVRIVRHTVLSCTVSFERSAERSCTMSTFFLRAIASAFGSSEETQTALNAPLSFAESIAYSTRGFPLRRATFFPGKRFEPPRAGMMQSVLDIVLENGFVLLQIALELSTDKLSDVFRRYVNLTALAREHFFGK